MKKLKYIIAAFSITLTMGFWIGCDKIEDPFYQGPMTEKAPATAYEVKKVLLEDYTGVKCPNCPAAAEIAHNLSNGSFGNVIVLGIHAGYLADPKNDPNYFDLRTPAGNEYYNYYEMKVNPIGVINKTNLDGSYQRPPKIWNEISQIELKKPLTLGIKITGKLDTNNTITTTITYKAFEELEGEYKLLIYLVEDGFVGRQANSDPTIGTIPYIDNYVFHNVFRETLNDTWGQKIGKLIKDEEKSITIPNYAIKTQKYEGSNYKLIAIIYRESDQYIEQAEIFQL